MFQKSKKILRVFEPWNKDSEAIKFCDISFRDQSVMLYTISFYELKLKSESELIKKYTANSLLNNMHQFGMLKNFRKQPSLDTLLMEIYYKKIGYNFKFNEQSRHSGKINFNIPMYKVIFIQIKPDKKKSILKLQNKLKSVSQARFVNNLFTMRDTVICMRVKTNKEPVYFLAYKKIGESSYQIKNINNDNFILSLKTKKFIEISSNLKNIPYEKSAYSFDVNQYINEYTNPYNKQINERLNNTNELTFSIQNKKMMTISFKSKVEDEKVKSQFIHIISPLFQNINKEAVIFQEKTYKYKTKFNSVLDLYKQHKIVRGASIYNQMVISSDIFFVLCFTESVF